MKNLKRLISINIDIVIEIIYLTYRKMSIILSIYRNPNVINKNCAIIDTCITNVFSTWSFPRKQE